MSLSNVACWVLSAVFLSLNSAGRKLWEQVALTLRLVWRCCSGKQSLWERSHLWGDIADSQHRYLLGCACFKQLDFRSLWNLQKGVGSWETVLQLMVSCFFHGFCWKLRVVGWSQLMVELCLICSVYYYFIPHTPLAHLTSSSLALFSHKSFLS